MAFRKLDLIEKHVCQCAACSSWSQPKFVTQPDVTDDGRKILNLSLQSIRSDELSKKTLNPDLINMAYIIETGNVIDPKQVSKLLNITDPADIERLKGNLSSNMYEYLLEHQDELIKDSSNE